MWFKAEGHKEDEVHVTWDTHTCRLGGRRCREGERCRPGEEGEGVGREGGHWGEGVVVVSGNLEASVGGEKEAEGVG